MTHNKALGALVKELEDRVDEIEKEGDDNIEEVSQRVDNQEIALGKLQIKVADLRQENRFLKRKLHLLEACINRHFGPDGILREGTK